MKKFGLMLLAMLMSVIMSGCGVVEDAPSAESLLVGKTFYNAETIGDADYYQNIFSNNEWTVTAHTLDGQEIANASNPISYSGTTVVINGVTYEVARQTTSVKLVTTEGLGLIFWDSIEEARSNRITPDAVTGISAMLNESIN